MQKIGAAWAAFNRRRIGMRAVYAVLCALLAASVLALLAAGMYVLPQADDYGFSADTHAVWTASHSLVKVTAAAVSYAIKMYLYWQGSYSACFLMALQPGLFGYGAYRLTAPFLLGTFLLATAFLAHALRRCLLPAADRTQSRIVLLGLLLVQLYNVPHPDQSWFWYNGSVYYTFFYSLSLVFLGCALWAMRAQKRAALWLWGLLLAALGLFLGGGPFSLIMVALCLLLCGLFWACRQKRPARFALAAGFVCLAAGFAANMFAPGNDVRATYFTDTPGPLHAVYLSVVNAANDVLRWSTAGVVLAALLLAPLLWRLARGVQFSFRLPGLAVLFSFGLLAMMLCPPIYAMGNTGPGRLTNVRFFCYVWWVLFCVFYLCGWAQRRLPGADACAAAVRGFVQRFAPALAVCCAVFLLFLYTVGLYRENPPVRAAAVVANGEARTFYGELYARFAQYEDPAVADVVVDSLTVSPYPIYHDDLSDDPTYFANQNVAEYYGKNSVRVQFPAAQ